MTEEKSENNSVRLQLAIARAGLASRRHAEEMIAAGRVKVNGKIIQEMGVRVNPEKDEIEVDGEKLPYRPSRHFTVMLNKPVGYLSAASDGHGGAVVTDLVKGIPARLVPVGRLDRDSCGLLLLSDDGELIARITHPRYGHRKVYMVEVSGRCDRETVAKLREPMDIDGYLIRPVDVTFLRLEGRHSFLRFVLHEGRNRQIRKMCAQVGLNVVSLMRIALDNLQLGNLEPGKWRELTEKEIEDLRNGTGKAEAKAPTPRRHRFTEH